MRDSPPARPPMVGQTIGVYRIVELIGAGGMGEVYRARDATLGRDVAIKILPPAFAADADRVARLGREARLLATLNHPSIATIHGVEDFDGTPALVLELVAGPTLAERLLRGPLPVAEALLIARQIADALEAAHEKGIIHRDLKPANIKFSHDGHLKVLDFGLAKAFASDGTGSGVSQQPTITATELRAGAIVGTPAYMSPEQARGQTIDKRTDVWAFGCVLYEMLTGLSAFPGGTISDTIAAVLEREPAWGALPAQTPAAIRQLLRRCLDKDPKRRLRDIGDARLEIEDVQSGRHGDSRVAPGGSRWRLAWGAGVALITLSAAAIGAWALRAPPNREVRLEINTPATRNPSVAVSPDGLQIVFAAGSQLWLRSLDSSSARPLPGTEGGTNPFWSPDSRSIGFIADTSLKRIDVDGGSAQTLASNIPVPLGGAWNREGTILFSGSPSSPLFRIAAGGGERVAATRVDSPRQRGHAFPHFLPDGRHFLFFAAGSPEGRGVYVGQLDSPDTRRLFDADAPAVYAATGHLLFVREGRLLAQAFDAGRLEIEGAPFPVGEQVPAGTTLSASAAGPIVYRTGDSGERQFVWVDRSGRETDKEVYRDASALAPAMSSDGRRIAVFRQTNGNMDIWSYDISRRAWDPITFDSGDDIYPVWSRDGTSVVSGSVRQGVGLNLYRTRIGAPQGSEELLLSTSQIKFPMDLSRDGRFLLYTSLDPKRGFDIWALPLTGERTPFEVVRTDFDERLPEFSPDGRWIAYQSNKTGRVEIYVRPFPGPGNDSRVSIDGGHQARWNPNGKELFYIGADDRLFAIPLRFSAQGTTVEFDTPRSLFATTVGSTAPNTLRQQYIVSPDGQSFVMNSVVRSATASPITVILNWKANR